jgi:hypothetical protein
MIPVYRGGAAETIQNLQTEFAGWTWFLPFFIL